MSWKKQWAVGITEVIPALNRAQAAGHAPRRVRGQAMVTSALYIDGSQIEAEREAGRLEEMIGQLRRNELVAFQGTLQGHAAQQAMQRACGANVAVLELLVQTDIWGRRGEREGERMCLLTAIRC